LCVVTETGRRCSCPHGLQLEAGGERSCLEPPTCDATQFTCNSGTCLPLHFQCDGSPDCDDRSDEENCEQCLDKCVRTGECITAAMRCNGVSECEDGTDERGCQPCEPLMYACVTGGTCILPTQLCNNHADCPGGDDERGCSNGTEGGLRTTHHATIRWELIIVVLVILGFVVALIIIVVLVKRKRQPFTESQDVFLACKPLANGTSAGASSAYTATAPPTAPPTHTHIATTKTSLTGYTGPTGSSTSPGMYDRERLTGASSNSSGLLSQHYPYETLNPPPSPVTERGDNSSVFSASSSLPPSSYTSAAAAAAAGRKRGAMRGRYVHLPPLPTPCSTDVCEDSEVDDDATPLRSRTRNRMPGAARNGGIDYDSADSFTGYSASHPPPCPTPRSQYFSDPSCPPSPLTERSFNPYPPPPSPVGTSDC
jgi:low density lipoprotein receptor-related protein 5/6